MAGVALRPPITEDDYDDECEMPLLFQNGSDPDNTVYPSTSSILAYADSLTSRNHSVRINKYAASGVGVVVERFHEEDEILHMDADAPDDILTEQEAYEIKDTLGEMPHAFNKHHRREGFRSPQPFNTVNRHQEGVRVTWNNGEMIESVEDDQNSLSHEDIIHADDTHSKESEDDPEYGGFRKYAKLILPHVGLVLLTCTYTVIGALVFYSIENPNELEKKREQLNMLERRQDLFISELLELSFKHETNRSIWKNVAQHHMHNLSDHLFTAFEKFFMTSDEIKNHEIYEIWTFSSAIFFAVTVVTTIGYGNPVVITVEGRMFCIIFSLFGIPLTLVTIADLGKFLSENLIWSYGNYLKIKHYLFKRRKHHQMDGEHVCSECQGRGLNHQMELVEEQRIPALLVLLILVIYTGLGGVLMSSLESWSFFDSFYWSFITMTTVGFGDVQVHNEKYYFFVIIYIIVGLAITTMCIDLVGVQYIRKIHYFGRKIQDAKSALAVVGGKVVLVSELYANMMQKRARDAAREAYIIENLYISKHIIPFVPVDIKWIKWIDGRGKLVLWCKKLAIRAKCKFAKVRANRVSQPRAQAGGDPSASFLPKSNHVTGRHRSSSSARTVRAARETANGKPPHGNDGRMKHREWGEKHFELKPEKIVPHKDSWMKFLPDDAEEDCTMVFLESTHKKKLSCSTEVLRHSDNSSPESETRNPLRVIECKEYLSSEILTILTYAPQIQFISLSLSKIRAIAFKKAPYIRVTLYDGSKKMEEKIMEANVTTHGNSRKLSSILRCNSQKRCDVPSIAQMDEHVASTSSTLQIPVEKVNVESKEEDVTLALNKIDFLSIVEEEIHENGVVGEPVIKQKMDISKIKDKNHNLTSDEMEALEVFESNPNPLIPSILKKRINSLTTDASKHKVSEMCISASFLFKVNAKFLHRYHLVIEIYDTINMKHELLGTSVIGPLSIGVGCIHWRQMIRRKGQPVCLWHPLKEMFPKAG
uniref:Ion_trans_2 domain-containing protein n=1 Tax=Rhabditophanes sp. KR3021 TaxID=114890 RepID=A0AC35TQ48_9BILA